MAVDMAGGEGDMSRSLSQRRGRFYHLAGAARLELSIHPHICEATGADPGILEKEGGGGGVRVIEKAGPQ